MRVIYPRHSDVRGYMPREDAGGIVASNISYPLASAASSEGHGFRSTNALLIDGKNREAVEHIWKSIRQTAETSQWLETGDRLVIGAVISAGKIEMYRNLHE